MDRQKKMGKITTFIKIEDDGKHIHFHYDGKEEDLVTVLYHCLLANEDFHRVVREAVRQAITEELDESIKSTR